MLKHLFFDYGGLLFRYDFTDETLTRANRLFVRELQKKGFNLSINIVAQARQKAIEVYLDARRQDHQEWSMPRIMAKFIGNLGLHDGGLVEIACDVYKKQDHISIPLPNLRKVLDEFSRRKKTLHIISDLPHDCLVDELKQQGFYDYFQTITISYEVGFRKPHPLIYQTGLNRAGADVAESAYISHEEIDLIGASDLGMKTFLIKPQQGESLEQLLVMIK